MMKLEKLFWIINEGAGGRNVTLVDNAREALGAILETIGTGRIVRVTNARGQELSRFDLAGLVRPQQDQGGQERPNSY